MSIDKPIPRSKDEPGIDWHALTPEQTIEQLDTPREGGLSSEVAARRLEYYGPNKLDEAPGISFWQMLLDQFNSFVVIMLIVAAIVSALLGDWEEAAAILAIVILNATLGVIQ
jgi:Ca2+-transporting ATPase